MRPHSQLIALFFLSLIVFSANSQTIEPQATQSNTGSRPDVASIGPGVRLFPLAFERSSRSTATFAARGDGYSMSLTSDGVALRFGGRDGHSRTVQLGFAGAAHKAPEAIEPESGEVNTIRGNRREDWTTGAKTYRKVVYRSVYPGIDAVFYGNQQQLEFDLIVRAGANPNSIALRVDGTLALNSSGEVTIGDPGDGVTLRAPDVYQEINGQRRSVEARYELSANREITLALGSLDPDRELVIDPVINYTAIFGGTASSYGHNLPSAHAYGVAVGSDGDIYVCGTTLNDDFPTKAAAQLNNNGDGTAFLSRYRPDGTLVYSTYYGGTGAESFLSVAVDSAGNAWVVGNSFSVDFPLVNPVQSKWASGGSTAVVARFSNAGLPLFATYYGGSGSVSLAHDVAVDAAGNAYVTGWTYSADFPPGGPYPSTLVRVQAAFVSRFNADSTVAYALLLPASSPTLGNGVAVDAVGNAYVTGSVRGQMTNIPAGGAQPTPGGGSDAFIAKVNSSGSALLYFTFFGGSGDESGASIAVDSAGNAYVTGTTNSAGLATSGAAIPTLPGVGVSSGFAVKLSADGKAFSYVTYLGGTRGATPQKIGVDAAGDAYVTGSTISIDIPVTSPVVGSKPGAGYSLVSTSDLGANWTGYETPFPTRLSSISKNPITGTLLGSGYRSPDGGKTWASNGLSYVSYQSRCYKNPSFTVSAGSGIYYSADDGLTWNLYTQHFNVDGSTGSILTPTAPVAIDPTDCRKMYAVADTTGLYDGNPGLARTNDGGQTWNAVVLSAPGPTYVSSLNVSADGRLWVLDRTGTLYRSADSGTTWTATSFPAPPAGTATSSTIRTTTDPKVLYVAVNGASIYRTGDGGGTWSALSLPTGTYDQLDASLADANRLYLSVGPLVLTSGDGGSSWTSMPPALYAPSYLGVFADPGNASGVYLSSNIDSAGFLTKLSADGKSFAYSTYLPGPMTNSQALALSNGGIWVAGSTPNLAVLTNILDATPTCTYSVTPSTTVVIANQTSVWLEVTAPSGCKWTASTDQTWASLPDATGSTVGASGSEELHVELAQNIQTTRTVQITVGGQTVGITQAGSLCSYIYSPNVVKAPLEGGTFPVTVTAPAGCPWSITSQSGILSFDVVSGTGNGTIQVTVPASSAIGSRGATVTATGGGFSVNQPSVCSYALSPQSFHFGAAGGNGTLQITPSNAACFWQITFDSASVKIAGGGRSRGNASVAFSVVANPSTAARSLSLAVAADPFDAPFGTILSSAAIDQDGTGPSAELSIVSSHSSTFPRGTSASYILTVSNVGQAASNGVVTVTETLPSALNLSALSGAGWNCLVSTATCVRSDALSPPGSYPTITATVSVASNAAGTAVNQVSVSGGNSPSSSSSDVTLIGLSQTITFTAPSGLVIGVPYRLQATASSGLPVSYAASGNCTLVGSTLTPNLGGCDVVAMQDGDGTYAAATPVTRTLVVFVQQNIITFNPPAAATLNAPLSLVAAASSRLPVTLVSNTLATCTVNGFVLTTVTVGTCSITASQNGNLTYATATTVTRTFPILTPFGDTSSTDYFFNAVNLLRQYGLTSGCASNPPRFCPNDNVTRAQMAVFIVRSIVGSDNFTASTVPYFQDVPSGAFGFAWIQKMKELGITTGCGTGNYCPNDPVTRGQMAVLVIRARLGAAADATFTYPSAASFTDVPANYPYFRWIQRMKFDQITSGCTATTYCPDDPVTRGQMAIFLMRGEFNQLTNPSQPLLVSASPATFALGQTTTISLTGSNTHFVQGTTVVNGGPGFTVGAVTVSSPTTLTAFITVDSGATRGQRTLLAATGTEEAVLPNGFVLQ